MTAAAIASSRSGLGRGASSRDAAYGSAQNAALTPRQAEYRIFARVTHGLADAGAAASDEPGSFARLAAAANENLRLWFALAEDLAGEANGLPDELRAGLIALAGFVERETPRVVSREIPPGVLVDVNLAVMKGLRGHREPE